MFDEHSDCASAEATAVPDDADVLSCAAQRGRVTARLFKSGDFDEAGFLLYGRLERLCERGLLRFESWSGDPATGAGDVLAVFRHHSAPPPMTDSARAA